MVELVQLQRLHLKPCGVKRTFWGLLSDKLGPVAGPLTEELLTRASHSFSVAQCVHLYNRAITPVLSALPEIMSVKVL